MSVSSGSGMYCYLVVAVSLATLSVVQTNDVQQHDAKKTVADPTKAPPSLADMFKLLTKLEERISQVESKRAILLRGRDGRDGQPGKPGKDGLSGKDGRDGKDGKDGKDGRNGKDGSPGPIGSKGETGRPGVRGPPGPSSGGVQYVRWGRTTCPHNGTLVYKGSVGGSFYTHKGGAANYVCLPETPKYGKFKDGVQGGGYMYGTEYQDAQSQLFTNKNLEHHDVPCAVCYVKTRNAKLMIPATYECPTQWTREYHGYLMSQYHSLPHPSEYICVDIDAEALPGTKVDVNGATLYHVEGRCGALPCLPYVEGRELTCAVCTK